MVRGGGQQLSDLLAEGSGFWFAKYQSVGSLTVGQMDRGAG